MLFDRISLANAFGALKRTELNEGKISEILLFTDFLIYHDVRPL